MNIDVDVEREPISAGLLQRIRRRTETTLFGEGLRAKVFRGGVWLGSGLFTEQVVRFGRNMLLARLLAPAAFGTMAIVASATSIIHTMMDIGVRDAVIQNPRGSEEEYVNAAWWMSMGRAASFWTILCILAPWIAKFYGNPELSPLFRVCAAGLLFDGAMSAKVYVAIKEMKFRKWAIINHVGGISGVLFTIGLSYFVRDVWALVIGYAAESAFRSALSYVICPFLPQLKWSKAAILDLWKFSRRMFGLSLLNLIFARTDIFVLAKLNSAAELGLYTMAVYLVQTPVSFIMNLLGQTILPAFARVQDDKARMNRILLQVTSAIVLVGMPAIVFAFFCGRSLLTLAYGFRYGAAAGPLIVASAVALLNLLNGQITSVFFATGRPNLHRFCIIVMASTMIVLIYPFVHYFGIIGGQFACLAAVLMGLLFQMFRVHRLTGLNLSSYAGIFLIATTVSLSVVAVCLGSRSFAVTARPLPNVITGVAGCLLAYALSAAVFFRRKEKFAF
jgi:O-antigen/teichoic acid export membrane protein